MPLRIAFLMDSMAGPVAGTERQLWELLTRIDRRRFEPELLLLRPRRKGTWAGDWPCPVTQFRADRLLSIGGVGELLKVVRHLSRRRIRLVHAFFPDSILIGPVLGYIAGAKVVSSRRDMGLWYNRARLGLVRISNRFVERIVANGHVVAAWTARNERVSKRKIEVIYNGVPWPNRADRISLRKILGVGDDAILVGMVANLRPVKRHLDALKAFQLVRSRVRNVHLVLMGRGREEVGLKRAAESEGILESVHFMGHVVEPSRFLEDLSVGMLCSESEGLSNALIEYLQAGVPAVCTDVGGNREVVADGKTGFVVPVGAVRRMADSIVRLLVDEELARRFSVNAKAAGQRFSVSAMVDAHMALYDRLLEPTRGEARGTVEEFRARS